MRGFPVVLAALATLAVAGCGETKIDQDKAEKGLTKAVTDQVKTKVRGVSCPSDVTAEKGKSFACVVTGADGTKGNATVRMTDDDGKVDFSAPFVHTGEMESSIRSGIADQANVTATVDCPDVIVFKAQGTLTCKARAEGTERTVKVTQGDEPGRFRYALG